MKEIDLAARWEEWMDRLGISSKEFAVESALMLIALQELGEWKEKYTKEEKQDLIHVGVCATLSKKGFYKQTRVDEDNWPHFELVKKLPMLSSVEEQEEFLKNHIMDYLEEEF